MHDPNREPYYSSDWCQRLAVLEERSFWFRSRNRVLAGLVKRFMRSTPGRFLEVGCGTGFVLKALAQIPHLRLVGAEYHKEGLEFARKRVPNAEFVQVDLLESRYHEEFDAAGAFDVIEHIEADETALQSLNRALRPGGWLFLSVPQHPWLWSASDDIASHKRRYRRQELISKLKRAGFQVRYVTSFVCVLLPLLWINRLLRPTRPAATTQNSELVGLDLPFLIDRSLEFIMRLDEWCIGRGISLPWGGSLLAVGQKPSEN